MAIEGEKNKQQYVDLINSLMDNQSGEIISVDPADSTKLIRSACELTNLQDVYLNDLGLKMKRNLAAAEIKLLIVNCGQKIWGGLSIYSKNDARLSYLQALQASLTYGRCAGRVTELSKLHQNRLVSKIRKVQSFLDLGKKL